MRKALAIALISCLILSGCSNKPQDTDVGIDDTPIVENNQIIKNEGANQNKPGYAQDNYNSEVYVEYNSGIMPEDASLAQPYGFQGNTYSGDELIKEETPDPEINTEETNGEIDSKDENIPGDDSTSTQEPVETTDNTSGNNNLSSTDENYRGKLLDEIDKEIYNKLYISRMLKLNTANSVEELGDKISADTYFCNTKRLLENIEYFDTGIKKYLADEESLNNSWNELRAILIKWRVELSNIETIEDFFESSLSLSSSEIATFEQFKQALDSVN